MTWAIIFLYLVLVYGIALQARRRLRETDPVSDRYLAGRGLNFVESFGSIMATEVSALSFLGLPALSFSGDFSIIYFYLGTLVSRPLLAFTVIPRIYGRGLTLYGIMGAQGGSALGQKFMALIYAVTKLLGVGVRFYAGSILVAEYLGLPLPLTLGLVVSLSLSYTIIGGLKAVVRTDLLQMVILVAGALTAHLMIPAVAGTNWGTLMGQAFEAGHISVLSSFHLNSFLIGFTGGALFDFCTHGFDQDYTQRILGSKTLGTARWAMGLSCFASVSLGLLFLPIGSLLWSYYEVIGPPQGLGPDKIFAHFITTQFPDSLKGLMLASVLAGTMSTLDSTINALSSVLWNDLWPGRAISKIQSYFKIDTILISVALLSIAVAASYSEGLFVLGMTISSWSVASLGALFFAPSLFPSRKIDLDGPTVGLSFASNLVAIALNTFVLEGPWQWNVYYGAVAALVALFLMGKPKDFMARV